VAFGAKIILPGRDGALGMEFGEGIGERFFGVSGRERNVGWGGFEGGKWEEIEEIGVVIASVELEEEIEREFETIGAGREKEES